MAINKRPVTEHWSNGKCQEDATAAAYLEALEDKANQENRANQEDPEHLDHQDSLVVRHKRSVFIRQNHHAPNAQLENQAHRVHLVYLAVLDPTDPLAALARMAVLEKKDHLEMPDQLALQAKTDLLDHLVHRPSGCHLHLVTKVHPAMMEHQDYPVTLENLVTMAPLARPDPKVHLAPLVHQARTEVQETKAHPVQTDPRESQVSVQNTAPSTAVSSSRTVLDDRRHHPTIPIPFPPRTTLDHGTDSPKIIILMVILLASMSFALVKRPGALVTVVFCA